MIALDASVLIAHLDPHDGHHEAATRFLADAAAAALLVHPLTMAEVLVGGVRVARGEEMLADLLAAGVRLARPGDEDPLRLANLRVASGLKLSDCCVLDTALSHAAELATFNQALAQAARRLHLQVLP